LYQNPSIIIMCLCSQFQHSTLRPPHQANSSRSSGKNQTICIPRRNLEDPGKKKRLKKLYKNRTSKASFGFLEPTHIHILFLSSLLFFSLSGSHSRAMTFLVLGLVILFLPHTPIFALSPSISPPLPSQSHPAFSLLLCFPDFILLYIVHVLLLCALSPSPLSRSFRIVIVYS
jgi:hypothetical protein